MAHQFIGRLALRLAALGIAVVVAAACGGPSTVPGPSTPSGPTTLTPCGVVSGVITGDTAIISGSVCTDSTSSVAYLRLNDSSGSQWASCSGTVISSTAVLTAAHCLADKTASVTIRIGSKEIPAASFAYSPGYNGTASDSIDVGVVIASSPIGQPIVPLLSSRDPQVNETVVIAGYGQSTLGTGAGTLRAGSTTISEVGSYYLVTNAGLNGAGACPGDSGGPLLVSLSGYWAVAGVTSTLTPPCVVATNRFMNVRNSTAWSFIVSHVPDGLTLR